MRQIKFINLSIVLLVLAGIAAAQGFPPRGERAHRLDALSTYLQLSDQQVADLKALQTQLRDQLEPLLSQLEPKMKALREESRKEPVNAQAVDQLRKEIQAIRNQVAAKRAEFGPKSRKVLTSSQLNALQTLQQALSLQAAAHDAVSLNLIEAPEDPRGSGAGMRGRFGPGFRRN